MKKLILTLSMIVCIKVIFAQTYWTANGSDIYNTNAGNVGIGTNTPATLLEVRKDQTAPTYVMVRNLSTGVNASARYDLSTAATNSYAISVLDNNNGNPFYLFGVGSGVSAVFYDAPEFNWRNLSGASFMKITSSGSIGIGVTNPGSFRLAVEGKIGAREIQVTNTNPWPDFVFDPSYQLKPLAEVEQYVKKYRHLPDVPSAEDVKSGIELGKMNAILLQKIEELTLHLIELNKKIEALEKKNNQHQ